MEFWQELTEKRPIFFFWFRVTTIWALIPFFFCKSLPGPTVWLCLTVTALACKPWIALRPVFSYHIASWNCLIKTTSIWGFSSWRFTLLLSKIVSLLACHCCIQRLKSQGDVSLFILNYNEMGSEEVETQRGHGRKWESERAREKSVAFVCKMI